MIYPSKALPLRSVVVATLLAFAVFGQAQARYTIKSQGKVIGKAALTQKLLEGGGKSVQLTIEMAGQGRRSATVRANSTYDPKGAPIRVFLESVATNPPSRRQITATFDAKGAHVVLDDGGARKVQDVPLVDTAPRNDPSQFWFLRDKPKPGTTATYYRFDAESLTWSLMKPTYVGPRDVTIGGTAYKGYLVRDNRSETIVDAAGLPLRITVGTVVFERDGK